MRHPTLALAAAAAALLLGAGAAQASLVLNGSFEANSAGGTVFNPGNATLNALVPNVTAFGARQGIDLQTVGSGYGLAPVDGRWKLVQPIQAEPRQRLGWHHRSVFHDAQRAARHRHELRPLVLHRTPDQRPL